MKYLSVNYKRYEIVVNNICNLSCYSCSALCDKPIGSNTFRNMKRETTLLNVKRFIDLIKDDSPKPKILFTGGEPTLTESLPEMIAYARLKGFNVITLTNGYDISKAVESNDIILDNHGVNKKLIDNAKQLLNKMNIKYDVFNATEHCDLDSMRKGISIGLRCNNWIRSISLFETTVYPCCILPYLDGWINSNEISFSLHWHGWNLYNDDLLSTINDWRNTIPYEVVRNCCLECWCGNTERGKRKIE